MFCSGREFVARWSLPLNDGGSHFSTNAYLLSNWFVRTGAVALALASVLRAMGGEGCSRWRPGVGFWGEWMVMVLVVVGICNVLPFVWRNAAWGWSVEREALERRFFADKFRPMLFFCSTMHARFSPKKHIFKYPLLYVGIPVTFKGCIGGLFSVLDSKEERDGKADLEGKQRRGKRCPFTFFTLDPASYTYPELPFEKKLDPVLTHHGINPSLYPHVYLVTTPRFLGYSFNPVSYYYLYSAKKELKLVVLEVLNTFGERHLYLLHADDPSNPGPRKGYTFAGKMEKAFHISPFNHRSGNYNIQVRDPLAGAEPAASRVDMNMVVVTRDGAKNMVARAFSVSPSFDMVFGGMWQGVGIAATWGYRTFLAVPWTMWEAWRLYRKKAVVYTRPEVVAGSGQRVATRAERDMQGLWIEYFKHRVSTYPRPISVTIILPESHAMKTPESITLQSKASALSGQPPPTLIIRVSNPRFFARFFSHQDPLQTVYLDITTQPHERRLAGIDNVSLFQDILQPVSPRPPLLPLPRATKYLLKALSRVRKFKTRLEFASLWPDGGGSFPKLHPSTHVSSLDEFFTCGGGGGSGAHAYGCNAVKAVLIDLIAFGEADSLELYGRVCGWVGVAAMVAAVKVLVARVSW